MWVVVGLGWVGYDGVGWVGCVVVWWALRYDVLGKNGVG